MTVLINVENLLRYAIGCACGIIFVLWIIKTIIPFGNTQTGGGGGFLLLLLLLFITLPIFQNTFARKSTLIPSDRKTQTSESDNDTIFVPTRTVQEALHPLIETPPPAATCPSVPPLKTLHFIQISAGFNEVAAHKLARKYEHLISDVVADKDKFIVIVSPGFPTKEDARKFINFHKTFLPDDAFLIELFVV